MTLRARWAAFLVASSCASVAGRSSACGGCFHPPTADSVVTGHRMAFALSDTRTVLWDQIEYSGAPGEFGWVLPIQPGAYVEASTDAWFEALDTFTTVRVTAPQLRCATDSGGGFGCGASDEGSNMRASGGFYGDDVLVLHHGTVGPYETVTLRSSDAGSLRTWLSGHGYVVPQDIDPIIDAYVSEGADFIALRLIPSAGVQQMTPVRVVTPGGKPFLPLRMVQAGTRGDVDIVLFVIGEQRYGLVDLAEAKVDLGALSFDFASNESNYLRLRDDALAEHQGVAFVTAFAGPRPFSTPLPGAGGQAFFRTQSGDFVSTLGELYFAQAAQNTGVPSYDCPPPGNIESTLLVTETGGASAVSASLYSCGPSATPYSDLSAAFIGMHPAQTWLARLEMRLPRDALTMDCNVAPSADQVSVSSELQAVLPVNRPAGCREPVFESRIAKEPVSSRVAAAWALGAFGALGITRRLRRRRSR